MNSYKTFSFRSSPQIIQRQFNIEQDGKTYRAHGVKGGNGEWRLEVYTANKWDFLGHAMKQNNLWEMQTYRGMFVGKTLKEVILLGFPNDVTA
jgi:hypothetical protein